MAKAKRQAITSADVMLNKMKFRDVKAACIMLGMDFDQVVKSDWHQLKSFYMDKYGDRMEKSRLEQFEDFIVDSLLTAGHKPTDPVVKFRQFSSITESNEEGEEEGVPKLRASLVKKAGAKKEKRKKKDRDESGLFKGTKKAYVFAGVRAGAKDKKIIEKTMNKFPDAKEKSIKIWIKKARKSGS